MMLPTAEQVLSNLPTIIVAWTALTLCWGVYIHAVYTQMMNHADIEKGGHRPTDAYNATFIVIANCVLFIFLLVEPMFVDLADPIIVIDIFYTAYLILASVTVCKWWKSKRISPNSHLLT